MVTPLALDTSVASARRRRWCPGARGGGQGLLAVPLLPSMMTSSGPGRGCAGSVLDPDTGLGPLGALLVVTPGQIGIRSPGLAASTALCTVENAPTSGGHGFVLRCRPGGTSLAGSCDTSEGGHAGREGLAPGNRRRAAGVRRARRADQPPPSHHGSPVSHIPSLQQSGHQRDDQGQMRATAAPTLGQFRGEPGARHGPAPCPRAAGRRIPWHGTPGIPLDGARSPAPAGENPSLCPGRGPCPHGPCATGYLRPRTSTPPAAVRARPAPPPRRAPPPRQ